MALDPIFKVIRPVKGAGERLCPKCRRETLMVVEKTDEKRTGVVCRGCGWGRLDLMSVRHEVTCEGGCGHSMGILEIPEGAQKKKYICAECSKGRREKKVEPDSEGTKVRYAVYCEAGCGQQTMWLDFPETEKGPAPGKLRGDLCKPCASKIKPSILKNNADEKIIRAKVEELKKKQAAGEPVTQADMLTLVDDLLKARRM